MCGIFGVFSLDEKVDVVKLKKLALHSEQRGKDSSGICFIDNNDFKVIKADFRLKKLVKKIKLKSYSLIAGHSRLVTDGINDNQPVVSKEIVVLHNGIIVNHNDLWSEIQKERSLEIDTEIINGLFEAHLENGNSLDEISKIILDKCKGVVSSAIFIPNQGKLVLISNNGSLFVSREKNTFYFASEEYPLKEIGQKKIKQIKGYEIFDIKKTIKISVENIKTQNRNLIPNLNLKSPEEKLLVYKKHNLKRCLKCILPETMPFINFDHNGICNYCNNYKIRNQPKPFSELLI